MPGSQDSSHPQPGAGHWGHRGSLVSGEQAPPSGWAEARTRDHAWAHLGGSHGQAGRAVGTWGPALMWHHWGRGWWPWGVDIGSWVLGRVGGDPGGWQGPWGLWAHSGASWWPRKCKDKRNQGRGWLWSPSYLFFNLSFLPWSECLLDKKGNMNRPLKWKVLYIFSVTLHCIVQVLYKIVLYFFQEIVLKKRVHLWENKLSVHDFCVWTYIKLTYSLFSLPFDGYFLGLMQKDNWNLTNTVPKQLLLF